MIFSSIYNGDDIKHYPEAIQRVIEYLKTNDFNSMETGVYEIQGKEIYAQVFDTETAPADERRPEVHEKYVDVQFLALGHEKIGFSVDTGNYEVDERLEERDLIFYKSVENEGFIEAVPGCYSIFFPTDVHRPGVSVGSSEKIRKVVVKVAVSII